MYYDRDVDHTAKQIIRYPAKTANYELHYECSNGYSDADWGGKSILVEGAIS